MNSRKMYYAMVGLLVVLIAGLGVVVVIGNNHLKKQSSKLMAAKLDQQSLNEQQTALIKAKKDLEKYKDLRNIARSIVPQDKDQARAVREIVQYANESGVSLESITFDDSSLGRTGSAPAPAPAGEGGATGSTTTPATPPTDTAPSITQAQPLEGIAGVYKVPMAIKSTKETNTFAEFITFLSKLENNRRTSHVEQINITPGETSRGFKYIDFELVVNIFVKP